MWDLESLKVRPRLWMGCSDQKHFCHFWCFLMGFWLLSLNWPLMRTWFYLQNAFTSILSSSHFHSCSIWPIWFLYSLSLCPFCRFVRDPVETQTSLLFWTGLNIISVFYPFLSLTASSFPPSCSQSLPAQQFSSTADMIPSSLWHKDFSIFRTRPISLQLFSVRFCRTCSLLLLP